MRMIRNTALVLLLTQLVAGCHAAESGGLQSLEGGRIAIPRMEAEVTRIMDMAGVPALSVAVINDSRIVYTKTFGVKNAETSEPADEQTIFNAASFSKTVFGWIVMQLVSEGVIDLDKPVTKYLGKPLPELPEYADLSGDDRWKLLTPRMCLSHTTGFPNWRFLEPDGRLKFLYDPGERHNYSGEGIALLQRVVERATGRGLQELASKYVFGPLEMTRTGYVWQEEWRENLARPHDEYVRTRNFDERDEADAAGSMSTTAGDYAKMLVEILGAEGERREAADEMLRAQIAIRHRNMFGPGSREESEEPAKRGLAWGLGWGLLTCGERGPGFFHTGHDIGFQNYTVTFPETGIGVVFVSNSDNFESVARDLAEAVIGETCSAFDWLGYPRFQPGQRREPPPEPVAIDVDPEILERYAGRYEISTGGMAIVRVTDGRLELSRDELEWTPLHAEAEDRFFVEGDDYRVVFIRDDAGNTVRFEILVEGITIPAERID